MYIRLKNKSAVQKILCLHLFIHTDTDSGIVEKGFAWLIVSVSSSAFSSLGQDTNIHHHSLPRTRQNNSKKNKPLSKPFQAHYLFLYDKTCIICIKIGYTKYICCYTHIEV